MRRAAAHLMRQILVNHANRRLTLKRGGDHRISLEDAPDFLAYPRTDILELDRVLNKLAHFDPRLTRIVELRFFGGLTGDEIADTVGISTATVKREWRAARAILVGELHPDGAG